MRSHRTATGEKKSVHTPVLLQEVLRGLDIQPGETVLDATLGGGGAARALCDALGASGTFVGLDQDERAVERARAALEDAKCRTALFVENFRHLDRALEKAGIKKIDAALFDLGLSSDQLEASGRGFSFLRDEPLLMTFSAHPAPDELTAETIVNDWPLDELTQVLRDGGERNARRIALAILRARDASRINTSVRLAEVIADALPRRGKLHPATMTFQALRMAVNDEPGALEEGLAKAFDALAANGRLAAISFHSGEDRLVKRYFRRLEDDGLATRLVKKPIVPTEEEYRTNPRARSAKLRLLSKRGWTQF